MPGNSLKIAALLLLLASTAAGQAPTAAPAAASAAPAVAFGQGVSIYPKNGQSQEQLWSDRYACDAWSKTQSGFDPAHADGGVPAVEFAARREQYRHAMTACLEAKGYRIGPSAAPAPAPAAAPPAPRVAPAAPLAAPPAAWYANTPPLGLKYHPFAFQIQAGYTLTEGSLRSTLDDGGNVGFGLTWFPTSWLPLGLRVDGTYSRFTETLNALNEEANALGTNVDFGHQSVYGGDVDVQLDLAHRSSRAKLYLLGGVGWYRQSTVFRQLQYSPPVFLCGYFACGYGYFPYSVTVASGTTPWTRSWNAGFGVEFAMRDPVSFFIEARYRRFAPYGSNTAFVPINIGLRF